MSDSQDSSSESTKKMLTFPECNHFRMEFDEHKKCSNCRVKLGRTRCSRTQRCSYCRDWDATMWDRQEKAFKAAEAKRLRRQKKSASEDLLDLHPSEEDQSFDETDPPRVKSAVRRASPNPWDRTDHRRSSSSSPQRKRARSSTPSDSDSGRKKKSGASAPSSHKPRSESVCISTDSSKAKARGSSGVSPDRSPVSPTVSPVSEEAGDSHSLPETDAASAFSSDPAPGNAGVGTGGQAGGTPGVSPMEVPLPSQTGPSRSSSPVAGPTGQAGPPAQGWQGGVSSPFPSDPPVSNPPVSVRESLMVTSSHSPVSGSSVEHEHPVGMPSASDRQQPPLLGQTGIQRWPCHSSGIFGFSAPDGTDQPPVAGLVGATGRPSAGETPPVGSPLPSPSGAGSGFIQGDRYFLVHDIPQANPQPPPPASGFTTDQLGQLFTMMRSCFAPFPQQTMPPQQQFFPDPSSVPRATAPAPAPVIVQQPLPSATISRPVPSSSPPSSVPSSPAASARPQEVFRDESISDSEDREEIVESDRQVSAALYDRFRRAVKASKGVFSVEQQEEGKGTAILLDDEADKPERIVWGMQTSVQDALKLCARKAQGVSSSSDVVETPLLDLAAPASKFKCFNARQLFGGDSYMLKLDSASDYQVKPPTQGVSFATGVAPTHYSVPSATLLHTEELSRRAAVYASISDSLIATILKQIPRESRSEILREQVEIMAQASRRSVAASVASAANCQLIRRDAVLTSLKLKEEYVNRARLAPFSGANVIGPQPREFSEELMRLREQHSLHQGLSSHFKVPTKAAPRSATQTKKTVHQRLGPPVSGRASQPFRGGEQGSTSSPASGSSGRSRPRAGRGSRGKKEGSAKSGASRSGSDH